MNGDSRELPRRENLVIWEGCGDDGGVQVVEILMRMISLDNEQPEANLSEAVKLFQETKYILLFNLRPFCNRKGTLQGVERFWFAFICFTLSRLVNTNKTTGEALVVYHNIIAFLRNLPQFFHKAAPGLVHIYANTTFKYNVPGMSAEDWVQNFVSELPAEPSAELAQLMSPSVKEDVSKRAGMVLESVFSASAVQGNHCSVKPDTWFELRRIKALKVYYMFLGATCATEDDVSFLLTNDLFHRSMLACSAELVLATTNTSYTIWFPTVLERSGITAFDLSKVIHCFLRKQLPRRLRWHLNALREILLERMIWKKGSPLYDSLMVARPYLSAEIHRLGLSVPEPRPPVDDTSAKSSAPPDSLKKHVKRRTNPSRRKHPVVVPRMLGRSDFELPNIEPPSLDSAFSSPSCQNHRACAQTVIDYTLNSILQLATFRIDAMVQFSAMTHPTHFQETVDFLVQRILSQRTSLLFNRHLDQLIMCSFYSLAKLLRSNSTSKELVHHYKKHLINPRLRESIILDWSQTRHSGKTGQDQVDMLTFYREVFAQSVKPFLVEIWFADKSTGRSYVDSHPGPSDMHEVNLSSAHHVHPASVDTSKTMEFAADTISELVKRLDLTVHIKETVYGLVQQLLIQQAALFLNRHIDQIVLCSLFHVTKILKLPLTFKEILEKYLKLQQGCTQVFSRIYFVWSETHHSEITGQDHVDIVTFYDKVFAPAVEGLLLDLASAGQCPGPLSVSRVLPSPHGIHEKVSTKSTVTHPKVHSRPSDTAPVIVPLGEFNQ